MIPAWVWLSVGCLASGAVLDHYSLQERAMLRAAWRLLVRLVRWLVSPSEKLTALVAPHAGRRVPQGREQRRKVRAEFVAAKAKADAEEPTVDADLDETQPFRPYVIEGGAAA